MKFDNEELHGLSPNNWKIEMDDKKSNYIFNEEK